MIINSQYKARWIQKKSDLVIVRKHKYINKVNNKHDLFINLYLLFYYIYLDKYILGLTQLIENIKNGSIF